MLMIDLCFGFCSYSIFFLYSAYSASNLYFYFFAFLSCYLAFFFISISYFFFFSSYYMIAWSLLLFIFLTFKRYLVVSFLTSEKASWSLFDTLNICIYIKLLFWSILKWISLPWPLQMNLLFYNNKLNKPGK